MRMLEEILEELEQGKSLCKILGREVYVVPFDWVKTVIFKHIDSGDQDGWIPVKERLPGTQKVLITDGEIVMRGYRRPDGT